jgi:hypothetical protein
MSEIKEKLQDLEKGLESLGQAPVVVGKDTDTTAKSYDAAEGAALQRELRKRFKQMSSAEITEMLDIQASRENGKQASSEVLNTLAVANPQIAKLLDASGGAALIRQDLEPMLYALFVKRFPLFERMRKEPANGLVHAYNQQTSYGDAVFQTELGTVTDDVNVYARQTTNVAVLATRRGISLKSQFAIQQGGAAGNHGLATELSGGVTAIAHKLQKQVLQGNASTSASAGASTELGAWDVNGFDGLRKLLGTAASAGNVITNKGTSSYTAAINETVAGILNNGGNPSAIVLSPTDYAAYTNELLSLVRYPGAGSVDAGLGLGSVATPAGALPLLAIPGDGVGSYAITSGGTTTNYRDMYVIDEDVWSMPFLGNDAITTLEIPVGVAGALTRLYIQFCMYGLASKAPQFNGKIRVTVA